MFLFPNRPIKYEYFLNRSIWLKDGTQTGTATIGQSQPESNGNEKYSTFSRAEASPPYVVYCYTQNSPFLRGESYPSAGDTVSIG